jgi:hypothetical protein
LHVWKRAARLLAEDWQVEKSVHARTNLAIRGRRDVHPRTQRTLHPRIIFDVLLTALECFDHQVVDFEPVLDSRVIEGFIKVLRIAYCLLDSEFGVWVAPNISLKREWGILLPSQNFVREVFLSVLAILVHQ